MGCHQEREHFYLGDASRDAADASAAFERKSRSRRFSTKRPPAILILEDFDLIRAYLNSRFKIEGYDILSAATIRDAIELSETESPQVVFINYDLNGTDVYEAIRQLRAILPLSYIVLVGGPDTEEIEENAHRSGASLILTKAHECDEPDKALLATLKHYAQ